MAQTIPFHPSPPSPDIRRVIKDDHSQILALFYLYLGSPADSRQTIVEQILRRLVAHLEMEEQLFFEGLRNSGPQGRQLVANAEVEHEAVKSMIHELQQAEADDDQALDEFFEKMMERVRAHFAAEERDLFPLGPTSLDPSFS
jgi:hemerythrin superfamily protein